MNTSRAVLAKFGDFIEQGFAELDRAGVPCGPDEVARVGTGALRQLTIAELESLRAWARAGTSRTHQIIAVECDLTLRAIDREQHQRRTRLRRWWRHRPF
jgi:hypothetical protein